MKTLLYILIFNLSAISFAQDPQLFENPWYLQKLTIEGVDYEAPNNNEIEFIPLNIFPDTFNTIVCLGLSGHDLSISNTEISVFEFVILLGDSCDLPANNDYEDLYYNGFFEWQMLNKTFLYSIEQIGDSLSLVLTNENGDKAFYGNEKLQTLEFTKTQYCLYPNPVKNQLFLNSKNSDTNLKIKIFNIASQQLRTQNLDFKSQISLDVSNLSSGIYFLNIADEKGNTTVKKFIKE